MKHAVAIVCVGVAALTALVCWRRERSLTRQLSDVQAELVETRARLLEAGTDVMLLESSPNFFVHTRAELADPEYVPLYRERQMRVLGRWYGAGMATLRLSSNERSRVLTLLFEREEAVADAREAALNERLSVAATMEAVRRAREEVDQELKGELGADGLVALEKAAEAARRDFRVGADREDLALSLGFDLKQAGVPLTPEQTEQMAEAHDAVGLGRDHVAPLIGHIDAANALTRYYGSLAERARAILSPAQYACALTYYAEQSRMAEYQEDRIRKVSRALAWKRIQNQASQDLRDILRRGAAASAVLGTSPIQRQ